MTKFKLNVYGKQASGYHLLTNDRLYVIVTPTRFLVCNNIIFSDLPCHEISSFILSLTHCFVFSVVIFLLFHYTPVKSFEARSIPTKLQQQVGQSGSELINT